MVKTLAVKKFGEKAALQRLAKKTLANVDLHRQSPIKINSKTKQFQTIVLLAWPDHFLAHAGNYRLQYKFPHQAITPCT